MSDLALKLIAENKRTRATRLDLGDCGLLELPDELFELVWLEELILSGEWNEYLIEGLGSIEKKSLNRENDNHENDLHTISLKIENLKNLKKIIIGGFESISWPLDDLSPLKKLEKLQKISICAAEVSDLSPIEGLNKLQYLDITATEVHDLKPIKNLENLTILSLATTNITDISQIKNLRNLQLLNLFSTNVKDLTILNNLLNLSWLRVSDTQVRDISSLKNLSKLEFLDLRKTKILDLSPLKDLKKLRKLDISHTLVNDMSLLKDLSKLDMINLSSTNITDLSPLRMFIKNGIEVKWDNEYWTNNKGIYVENCPLINPPIEIVKQGNQAILDYWNQIEEQGGTEELYEAKMIIVGEGETGKTTLFEKMQNPKHQVGNTAETHGIKILEGLELYHKDIGDKTFHANLWDFGGQELQYMTHQFFLTPRAFYVLMMDARKGSPNLAYWFKIISLLGKESQDSTKKVPLLLVFNKKKGSTGLPQYQGFLEYYKEHLDEEFLEVDFAVNDKRFENLMERIRTRLVNLPIVKSKLPKQWKPIREALRAEKDPWITVNRYDEICSQHQITDEKQQWQLSNYLHQLGSILHFQNDESLMDTVILSPEWAVDGVYAILKDAKIREKQFGRFSKNDIFKILQRPDKERKWVYKRTDAQKILQLMAINNFDICYKTSNGDYIAPQHLPANAPTELIWHNKNQNRALEFRFQYPIMPKGLISRLIVRLSEFIEKMDNVEIVWKKGVVLNIKKDGETCRVLIKEDNAESQEGLRQIIIQVMGELESRKYALQKVRDEVEELHKKWFRSIKAEEIIPCCCPECQISEIPEKYLLNDLLKLRKNALQRQCNTGKMVPIQTLLEGIYAQEEIKAFNQQTRQSFHQKRENLNIEVKPIIHIENNPTVSNTINNQPFSQKELAAAKSLLTKLGTKKAAQLEEFVEMLPEPESKAENQTVGKQIGKWLNKNAEGMVVNVSASVYYDVLKFLFGF